MYEHPAKMEKMNMVCDDLRDCLDVEDKPLHYSSQGHQDYPLEYTINTGLFSFPLLSLTI